MTNANTIGIDLEKVVTHSFRLRAMIARSLQTHQERSSTPEPRRYGHEKCVDRQAALLGADLAAFWLMAKVLGAAGEHAGRQSVAAFKRMFLTLLIVAIVAALCEGVMVTTIIIKRGGIAAFVLPLAIGLFLFWLLRYATRRIEMHETERLNWRKGALGEYEVGAELERLSDDYSVFNNLNTAGFGNFDHVVIGPAGLFAIETKNWSGLISANGRGELKKNGKDFSTPHVRNFLRRAMMLRDQIVALTHSDDLYVRSIMVFPKAHIEAKFGTTGHVHCVTLSRLRDYIDNEEFSQKLTQSDVDRYVRALHGIAGMDKDFGPTASIVSTEA